ncbi:Diadenosine hexaphosphate hydrolase [Botrimarina colliarenosi]|uniref:Diadenosine hexaphosphate hydrolase n=1 Tax=Botrimarina colliarenosi TaxID=2528001 RepID=A0A5C6ABG0_9BACT|nr:NUDIX domain-containing protein [Botrimarina colliarenosi]TWT96750.1 Diadenosine hexaphosphate hydrolase [Botrimarina colliarenosi]
MHREPLRQLLQAYRSANPSEAPVADRILRLVDEHADCFERTCRPGHLTGSAWVVSCDGQRHLLLLHRKLGKWLQPGGHADGDADLRSVAFREAEEETGLQSLRVVTDAAGVEVLDIDVHVIPARYDAEGNLIDDAHEHHDIRFLLQAVGDDAVSLSDESHALAWYTPNDLRKLTQEESVLRLLEKAEERLKR